MKGVEREACTSFTFKQRLWYHSKAQVLHGFDAFLCNWKVCTVLAVTVNGVLYVICRGWHIGCRFDGAYGGTEEGRREGSEPQLRRVISRECVDRWCVLLPASTIRPSATRIHRWQVMYLDSNYLARILELLLDIKTNQHPYSDNSRKLASDCSTRFFSELVVVLTQTHKFESRYAQNLIVKSSLMRLALV